MSAIDDQNDRLRARVEAAMGAMPQGLTEDDRDEWQATADRLFFEGVYSAETISIVSIFPSGEEIYVNRKGRCEDAPCCGCCS